MEQKSSLRRFAKYYRPVIGLFLLDSFFAILLASVSVGTPFLTQFIIKSAQASQFKELYIGIGLLVTILVVRMLSNAIVTKWGHYMGVKMEVNMRKEAVKKMHRLPLSHFDKTETGTYISRIVSDLKDIPEFAHHGPEDLIIAVLTAAGGFTYAFLQTWIIGLTLAIVFIIGITVIYFIRVKWRKIWTKVRESNSEMSASIGFQVEGVSEIKSYNSEKFERKRFNEFHKGYKKSFFKLYNFEAWFTVSNVLIMSLTSIVTLSIGGWELAEKKITIAQLVGLTSAATILNQPMQKFVNVYTMISRGSSSVDRFFEFMDLEEEKSVGTLKAPSFKGNIEFKNVYFSYQDEKDNTIKVLKNFSLKIKAGEKVAIIGATGIGKSTLLKLLLRYYEIQKGKILIDGQDISNFDLGSLRTRLGYIQQQPTMFNDTIKNNILYGRPEATMEEIIKASNDASIQDFIDKLDEGFETIVGPRGSKLSGGQKQRIAIARAFLAHSDIFLLDEATSALDNETEAKIKDSIDRLTKNKTTLIVAHRLSTIKEVDRIIVLGKGGKILQEGNHKQLIKTEGYYKAMHI